jgi:uncharacterized protein YgiM (DUF1202 family)
MAPLFGESDEMRKVGEDMQKLSEQVAQLKQELAAKTKEADSLRTQAAHGTANTVALEDANAQLEVLRKQLSELQAKQTAQPSTPAVTLSSSEQAAAAPPQHQLEIGATAWVTRAGGLPLRLRSGPSLNADIVDRLKPGTQLTLMEGPVFDTGHNWWHINTTDGRQGWVAGDQLVLQPD